MDAFDDPLPAGAVARMGSTRFRHTGLADFVWPAGGKTAVTIGSDEVVRWWDPETGHRTKAVALKKTQARQFAISPDGKLVAACSPGVTTIFDANSGEVLGELEVAKWGTGQLGFSPDGKMLYVTQHDGRINVWDWRAKKPHAISLGAPQWGADSSFHLHFSPDGKHFVAGVSWQQPLAVFSTATWEKEQSFSCHAATSVFTPDAKRLVVCSMKNDAGEQEAVLRVFELQNGKEIATFPLGQKDLYLSLAVSPDGRVLGCGASERSCLFDLAAGKVLHRLGGWTWGLAFSPDGKTFVAVAHGTHLRVWDVATGKERHEQPGNFGWTLATDVSPDGRLFAAADWSDRAVTLWDTASGTVVRHLPLRGEQRYTRNVTFSPDGRTLASGQYEGFVQVWDVATGKELRAFKLAESDRGGERFVDYLHIRPTDDAGQVVTLESLRLPTATTVLKVWDGATGKSLRGRTIPGDRHPTAWSPDGETLALGMDGGAVLIDLETGEDRATLPGTTGPPVMSPDGRLVAVSLKSERAAAVGVYEVATGKAITTVSTGPVSHFAVAADNRSLVATDATHIRAWDLPTGKEVARRELSQPGADARTSPTVTRLIALPRVRAFTAMTDGTGLVWDLSATTNRAGPASAKQLEERWADLRNAEAANAYVVIWRMNDIPPDLVVEYLRPRLRPEPAPDPAKLRQLIADLNSDTFRVREKAVKELQDLGHLAVPALRKALDQKPAPEAARRIEQLLARKSDVGSRPEQLRRLRAMQVLERAATKEARALLTELAEGLPLAPETKGARAALGRLGEPPR